MQLLLNPELVYGTWEGLCWEEGCVHSLNLQANTQNEENGANLAGPHIKTMIYVQI